MVAVNIHEAKTHLSRLLEQVAKGEDVIIAKAGKPLARLVPFKPVRAKRNPGQWKGKVRIRKDFDELPEDVVAAFLGQSGKHEE